MDDQIQEGPMKTVLYAGFIILIALHQDIWLWRETTLWFGLPAGLTYHLVYCLVCCLYFALLVKYAWPLDARSSEVGS